MSTIEHWKLAPFVLLLCLAIGSMNGGKDCHRDGMKAPLHLKMVKASDGWGYEIYQQGQRIIYQPCIPATEGQQPFRSKTDARKTGELVLEKMKRTGRPHVTRAELDSLRIKY